MATPTVGLDIEVEDHRGYAVVTVCGDIDVYSCAGLRKHLIEATDRGADSLIIDASGIEFLDSSGLGILVGAYKRAVRRRGVLQVAAAPERVEKMLKITGLTRVFGVFKTVEDAVDDLERRAKEQA